MKVCFLMSGERRVKIEARLAIRPTRPRLQNITPTQGGIKLTIGDGCIKKNFPHKK